LVLAENYWQNSGFHKPIDDAVVNLGFSRAYKFAYEWDDETILRQAHHG